MTTIGYARVSTDGQSLAAQDAALQKAGCAKVYAEKQSGASSGTFRGWGKRIGVGLSRIREPVGVVISQLIVAFLPSRK
jgi:hypothetical protein